MCLHRQMETTLNLVTRKICRAAAIVYHCYYRLELQSSQVEVFRCHRANKEVIKMAQDAPGMRGYRSRNTDGELREKRDDTHVGTVERIYGVDLGMRSDAHLKTAKERNNVDSLDQLIRKVR